MAKVTVFGGTGFLGRRIVDHLALDGMDVRIAVRRPGRKGSEDRVAADIRDEEAVAAALAGADGAVNAVSAYVEKGPVSYAAVHERGAANLARQCARLGVTRLVHISGIGADAASPSKYIGSRGRGEALVREVFPDATILRPSVMFGPDDAFLNTLAEIGRRAPVFVLIGGGRTRLQPVHVANVAAAVSRVLRDPSSPGRTYELGGPGIYTLREIVGSVLAQLKLRRPLIPVPLALAKVTARLCELLPRPPLSVAQVELLEHDNVVAAGTPGLQDLSIVPLGLEDSIAELPRR